MSSNVALEGAGVGDGATVGGTFVGVLVLVGSAEGGTSVGVADGAIFVGVAVGVADGGI